MKLPNMTINVPELRRLAEAATPGPWVSEFMGIFDWNMGEPIAEIEDSLADAAYIAAVNPALMLRLLDLVEDTMRTMERIENDLRAEATSLMQPEGAHD